MQTQISFIHPLEPHKKLLVLDLDHTLFDFSARDKVPRLIGTYTTANSLIHIQMKSNFGYRRGTSRFGAFPCVCMAALQHRYLVPDLVAVA
jgi:phosphoserine phosphatase